MVHAAAALAPVPLTCWLWQDTDHACRCLSKRDGPLHTVPLWRLRSRGGLPASEQLDVIQRLKLAKTHCIIPFAELEQFAAYLRDAGMSDMEPFF